MQNLMNRFNKKGIKLSLMFFSFFRYEGGCCSVYEWNSELGNCTGCQWVLLQSVDLFKIK